MRRSTIRTPEDSQWLIGAALALSSLLACGGKEYDLPNDVVWTSPHFAFHTRSTDQSVCEDIVAKLEQHFASIQDLLGFPWPSDRTIHYYKFASQSDFAASSPCAPGSAACTDRNHVYAYNVFEQHELVHAYLWPSGVPPPVIAEGTAVALVCNWTIPDSPSLSLADAMHVVDPLSDKQVYETGGRFVRYLLAANGPGALLRFYAQLSRGSSFEELDRVMHAVFGIGAADAWAAMLTTPASCPPVFECSREPIPLDGSPIEVSPTCGLGEEARTFKLAADAEIAITGSSVMFVATCDPIAFSPLTVAGSEASGTRIGVVQLPEGSYYLDIRAWSSTTVQISEARQPWHLVGR